MLTIEILLLVGLVVLITHALEAVTGFGCTVLAFPFVIALTANLELSKMLLSVLAWILALYFVITQFRQIDWKQFLFIVLLSGAGMPAGMVLFRNMNAAVLTKVLGGFILLSAAVQLYKCFVTTRERKMPRFLFLLAGGIIHGAFATGGPLIVLYTAQKIPDKGKFRATMCLLWAVLNTILIVQYALEKKLNWEAGRDIVLLLPFLISGIVAGEMIHKKVSTMLFKKIVFMSLFFIGIIMML
ncbi:MAG: sulfite exporter TauE/SafE family protein [Bacteroidales bacterium]|jgi:uncharacterized membrane protein YfcA|nr:sulfite exporter TauE/SafE family protein [Bacteroidales bacterium]